MTGIDYTAIRRRVLRSAVDRVIERVTYEPARSEKRIVMLFFGAVLQAHRLNFAMINTDSRAAFMAQAREIYNLWQCGDPDALAEYLNE